MTLRHALRFLLNLFLKIPAINGMRGSHFVESREF